jgi:MFS transporter, FSR family, fosmidomycin resistance protein
MNSRPAIPGAAAASNWHRMRVWAGAHAVDDFYQGLVPAAVPYFVLERHVGYLGASGLALAATLGSALPQVAFGLLADRHRLAWMSPLGVAVAQLPAGLRAPARVRARRRDVPPVGQT